MILERLDRLGESYEYLVDRRDTLSAEYLRTVASDNDNRGS